MSKSIGRTGIEMEALTAVSVAALELYDMLQPIDDQLEIGHIRLANKTGGKSDNDHFLAPLATCAILVCSHAAAVGLSLDNRGEKLKIGRESRRERQGQSVQLAVIRVY